MKAKSFHKKAKDGNTGANNLHPYKNYMEALNAADRDFPKSNYPEGLYILEFAPIAMPATSCSLTCCAILTKR